MGDLKAIGARMGMTVHGINPKRPKADLLERVGGVSATPQYRDRRDGSTVKTGYVVNFGRGTEEEWFTFYRVEPWEVSQD